MPGIAGIISKKLSAKHKIDLDLMVNCMVHETFYTSDIYINDQIGLYAGWVCHKGSFSDCMPVFNENKDLILLFSGENFADMNLINQLKNHGHIFNDFNASYLIHLYEDNENEFFKKLNGWFSGLLVDLRNATITLFNDRYGMQRIYYYESKDAFLFSSEAKSLLKIRPELRDISMQSLGEFFSCNCVLENRTLFSRIFLLPGGSTWTFNNLSNVRKKYYFKQSTWENQPILEKETFYKKLRQTFQVVLPRYFYSKNPIAMSLTSGLDTRMIMSCLANPTDSLSCYTFSGMYRDLFDARIARKIAETCHQSHQILRLGEDFLSDFAKHAEKTVYITDGCSDICSSHDVYFNSLARQIAPIRMTGKFGSEILRDYTQFKTHVFSKKLFHPDFDKYVKKAVKTFLASKNGHKLSFAVFKEIPWYEYGRFAIEMSKLILRTPYMDNDLVELMYQAPKNSRSSIEIPLRLIKDCNPSLNNIMTDRGIVGNPNHILSLLSRLFYYSLFKIEYTYLFKMPDWLAKLDFKLTSLILNKLILGRYKFEYYRLWFRKEISGYLREILLDKQTSDNIYLNKNILEKMLFDHIKGNRDYTNEIAKTLTLELIQRLLIENK